MGEERVQVLAWLDESRAAFLAAIKGVSEPQWRWKPAADRWSVGEIAEHVVLTEALLFATCQRALAGPPNADWEEQTKGKTEFIVRVMPARQGRAVSPVPVEPRNQLTRDQVVERFARQRVEIVEFAGTLSLERMKQYTDPHPMPVFGTLNAYQWFIYVPLHTLRHGKQIQEVKGTPGYPDR